jgi:hypothetical protein
MDNAMNATKRYAKASITGIVLCLALAGCSKPSGNVSTPATVSGEATPPFQQQTGTQAAEPPALVAREAPGTPSTKPSPLVPNALVIPASTSLTVRLDQTISSQTAQAGERFSASLDAPLVINGQTVAPRGASAIGHVVACRRSGRLHNPGYLRLALDSIEVNGKTVPVHSSYIFVEGASHKKRNWAWIGGSTAGGALLGGLIGGGKGAAIGSLAGAGGGTTTAMLTGKHDVVFAAERRLTFRTTQPVRVS